jgi:proteasome lid subunit RPN8/RPN11
VIIENYPNFKQAVLRAYPFEACGFIKDNFFVPVANIAGAPFDDFKIHRDLYLQYEHCPIVHSHPYIKGSQGRDYREPSLLDQKQQIATGVEWGIVATDGEYVSEMNTFGDLDSRPPLIEREFIECINDCYSLVQDWHWKEHKIRLPQVPRLPGWDLLGQNLISNLSASVGMINIDAEPIREGDLLFLSIHSRTNEVNHMAIYTGDNNILHHMVGRLSGYESYTSYRKYIVQRVRHKDLP